VRVRVRFFSLSSPSPSRQPFKRTRDGVELMLYLICEKMTVISSENYETFWRSLRFVDTSQNFGVPLMNIRDIVHILTRLGSLHNGNECDRLNTVRTAI